MTTIDQYNPRFDVRISGLTLSADVTRLVTSVAYDNNADTFANTGSSPDLGCSSSRFSWNGSNSHTFATWQNTDLQDAAPGGTCT